MGSNTFTANCKRCERVVEFSLFSRTYPYCSECAAEVDEEKLRRIRDGKQKWIEDLPGMPAGSGAESELERQARYTAEDHRRVMDDHDRRNRDR